MPEWIDALWQAVFGGGSERPRRVFRRRLSLSGPVVAWLRDERRTEGERWAFAELLLRLDADPLRHSTAILRPGVPAGLRWAAFGERRAILIFDPSEDRIRVLTCA